MTWKRLLFNKKELQLVGTLDGGQSFRWAFDKNVNIWTGVFSKTVFKLRKDDDCLSYEVVGSLVKSSSENELNELNKDNDVFENLLRNYFRLDMNLGEYYKKWSEKDELFKTVCTKFYGIRMLNQEPVENLFSFICSQNNHISRISSMVEKLCTHYGEEICNHDGVTYYAFPELEKLAEPKLTESREEKANHYSIVNYQQINKTQVEKELRDLGFGYRAKFIQKSAAQIVEWGGNAWFNSLKEMKYEDAREELMKLFGIGPKVADCICLMSLNHLKALPVDTHVYQIATQNYLPHLKDKKNISEKMYAEISDHFRSLFGDLAGWAHTVLFCADLYKFRENNATKPAKKILRKKKK